MAQHTTDKSPFVYPSSLEKGSGIDDIPGKAHRFYRHRRITENMPSARNFILALLVGLLVTLGLASAVTPDRQPCQDGEANAYGDIEPEESPSSFSRLLSSASPEALHRFLHSHFPGTYRHGVFDSDQAAVEAIHVTDPELASSIVQLAKRQGANETVTDSSATAESTETSAEEATPTETETTEEPPTTAVPTATIGLSVGVDPSTEAPTEAPTEATTEAPTETPTEAPTEAPTETPTETPTEAPTETPTQTPTETPTETSTEKSTETPTEPPVETTTTETPPTSESTNTPTEAPTSEDDKSTTTTERTTEKAPEKTSTGTTLEKSPTPAPTHSTRTSTIVSTLPGGAHTTVTNVEVVTAGPEEPTATEASGELQTNLAVPNFPGRAMEVLIGAVIGGVLLA